MDLDALASALDAARSSGDLGGLYDELAAQGWRRQSRKTPSAEELTANVNVDPITGCWLWRGRLDASGYGLWQGQSAHRLAYRVFLGPIPSGHHVDHLCRTRDCVNAPGGHLEAVTQTENNRRAVAYVQQFPNERVHHGAKRWCIRGHAFDELNTGIDAQNKRYCKRCRHEHLRTWRKEVAGQPDRRPEFHIDAVSWLAHRNQLVPVLAGPQVTTSEAAQLCGLSVDAFRHWRSRNPDLLRVAGQQRSPRFSLAEVQAMLAFHTDDPWSRRKRPD